MADEKETKITPNTMISIQFVAGIAVLAIWSARISDKTDQLREDFVEARAERKAQIRELQDETTLHDRRLLRLEYRAGITPLKRIKDDGE